MKITAEVKLCFLFRRDVMGSQNYLSLACEKLGHIMLDDKRRKASDIYKLALKRQKKGDYNPPSYNFSLYAAGR